MLVPAILYKEEIISNFKKYYYTEDLMYETGYLDNQYPEIADTPRCLYISICDCRW